MAKLILSMDGLVLKEIVLDQERISVGRKPENDVQIDNLAISGQHALITTILNDAFLEDCNSTNGTYVNGQPIKKHVLKENDIIELGKYRLRFIAEDAKAASAKLDMIDAEAFKAVEPPSQEHSQQNPATVSRQPGCGQTQILPPELIDLMVEDTDTEQQPSAFIRVMTGTNQGRELELSKAVTTLGKPGKQVVVIARRPNGYFIAHVEGDLVPQVNGTPLTAKSQQLYENDRLLISGVEMAFCLRATT